MGNRIRSLVVGLGVILVSLACLLAVSSLVPAVSCTKSANDFVQTHTQISISLPGKVDAGQSFLVEGTLKRGEGTRSLPLGFGEPFPRQRVTISSDFFREVVTTDSDGSFSVEVVAANPGIFRIQATYAGDQLKYYLSSSDTKKLVVAGATTNAPIAKPRSSSNLLYLLAAVILFLAATCLLYFRVLRPRAPKDNTDATAVPRRTARTLPRWILYVTAAVVIGAILFAMAPRTYFAARDDIAPEDGARIPTKTVLNAPATAGFGESIEVTGTLTATQQGSDLPLQGQRVDIWIVPLEKAYGLGELVATAVTSEKGDFERELSIDQPGQYEISAVFADTGDLYLESSDVRSLTVSGALVLPPSPNRERPTWLLIVGAALAVLALATASYLFARYGWRRNRARPVAVGGIAVIPSVISQPAVPPQARAHGPGVKIALPQIAEKFPDVWGRDESLIIIFAVDGTRHSLEQYSVDIELAPDSTVRAPLGRDGRASQEHSYPMTGKYEIRAVLVKDVRNGYLPASRFVRIVNYREEVVRLYNEVVAILKTRGVSLSQEMTAREVETRLTNAMAGLSRDTIRDLVRLFEEANYSLHPIARPSYERMYLASVEVEKHAGK